jgi:hypothetical protein
MVKDLEGSGYDIVDEVSRNFPERAKEKYENPPGQPILIDCFVDTGLEGYCCVNLGKIQKSLTRTKPQSFNCVLICHQKLPAVSNNVFSHIAPGSSDSIFELSACSMEEHV